MLISQTSETFFTHFGTTEDEIGNCIIESYTSTYLIVGQTTRNIFSQNDVLITRIDSMGVPIWQNTIGGESNDVGKSLIELQDSSIIFVGYTASEGNGGYDALIVRLDKNGNLIWKKTYGGLDWDFANSIVKSDNSSFVICGTSFNGSRGKTDGFIIKYDIQGNIIWKKILGGKRDDKLNKIIRLKNTELAAIGTTMSYGLGDTLGNIWLIKVNSFGDSIISTTYGSIGLDVGNSIIEDKNNNLLLVGGTYRNIGQKEDVCIIKVNSNLIPLWEKIYGLSDANEEALDVLNSNSSLGETLVLYGTYEQAGFGLNLKNILINNSGDYVAGGSFGGAKDDLGHAMTTTKRDKGYIACGYTESYGAKMKDVFVVKYDSTMFIGPLFLDINEFTIDKEDLLIYPTIVMDNKIYIENLKNTDVQVTNLYGSSIVDFSIIKIGDFLFEIVFPKEIHGFVILSLNKGKTIKKCFIY